MTLNILKQHKIGLSAIFLTWFIFFVPIISGEYVYFLDDLKIIYYPIETAYAEFQHNWQLPLWANEFGFGQQLLGWGQLGFFTPLHLIMRALYVPPLALLQISVVAYFLLGSIGMYAFLIRRNLHPTAATLGAIVFAYCGFSIGHLNHVNFYTSTMLLPWLLIAIYTLFNKQTLARATTLALTAAAIAMSGQPQVTLYVFIAATVISIGMFVQKPSIRAIPWVIYAVILAFLLSSLAILPLQEFLPDTERAAGLPYQELFEFSYPPWHTVTLVLPYFFGDHSNYWGAKGFQELAAFTGIIPLILAGGALTHWKQHRSIRATGIALVVGGALLALGKYSPVYTYLIDNHYITSIGVVGRFVFFFDIGIVLLAAVGLHDLTERRKAFFFGYLLPLFLIAMPFGIAIQADQEIRERFHELWVYQNITWWLIFAGIAIIPIATYFKKTWLIVVLAAGTLIFYAWDYNPRAQTSQALSLSPFIQDLQEFRDANKYPARLYSAERLPLAGNPQSEIKLSEPISPLFSVFQKISPERKPFDCIVVPVQADSIAETHVGIMVRTGFDGTIWYNKQLSSADAYKDPYQHICFPGVPDSDKDDLILSFTSSENTNMKVFTTPSKTDASNVYFVRVAKPTPNQLHRSKKNITVQYVPDFPRSEDIESQLLMRHIQAIAGSSSARWIGALSVRPYREFIDGFFANDSEAFDGDGIHALTRNKKLMDFVGITHFAQGLEYGQTNDPMLSAGYVLEKESDTGDSIIRLYKNPFAFPKVFMVPNAEFIAANDEIRTRLRANSYDPASNVYLSGEAPPNLSQLKPELPLQATATILTYNQARVDVTVETNKEAFLVLTDSTTPQWQTYIDDKRSIQLRANTIFKAAQVPAGTHTISFRYESPATEKAKTLTTIGIILTLLGYAYGYKK